jgi:hypothetical protein
MAEELPARRRALLRIGLPEEAVFLGSQSACHGAAERLAPSTPSRCVTANCSVCNKARRIDREEFEGWARVWKPVCPACRWTLTPVSSAEEPKDYGFDCGNCHGLFWLSDLLQLWDELEEG